MNEKKEYVIQKAIEMLKEGKKEIF